MAEIDCPNCGMIHKYMGVGLTELINAAVRGELHTVGTRGYKNGRTVVEVAPRCLDDIVPCVQTKTHPNPHAIKRGRPRKAVQEC